MEEPYLDLMRMKEPYLDISVGRKFKLPVVERQDFVWHDGEPFRTERPLRAAVLRDGFPLMYVDSREFHPLLQEESLKRYGLHFLYVESSALIEALNQVRFTAYAFVQRHEGGILEYGDGREVPMMLPFVVDEGSLSALMRDGKSILDDRMQSLGLKGEGVYYIKIDPVYPIPEKKEVIQPLLAQKD